MKVVTKKEKNEIVKLTDSIHENLLGPILLNMPQIAYLELTRLLSLCQTKLTHTLGSNYPERKISIR